MALRGSFSFSTPAIDMSEDEKAYKISAELPGIDAKDIDVSVTGDMLVLIRWQGRTMAVPLSQLAAIDPDEATAEAIADWHYWVAMGYRF